MEIKSINPKLKHSEIAQQLAISTSTLQRYRREINLFSPYRVPPSSTNTNRRKQKTSNHTENDLKATSNDLKVTSIDLKMISRNTNENGKEVKSKNFSRSGDPSYNQNIGRDPIEQAFSSN